jgi:hypothetical protein
MGPSSASCAVLIHHTAEGGIVQDRRTAVRAWKLNQRLAFSLFLHPGRCCRCLMNIQIVPSWHLALCLCPSSTDGFRHRLVLTQPLIAAAVLLSKRRPVSSWHCICLQRQHRVAPQIHLTPASWSVETPSRIYSRLVDSASKGPNTRRIQVHNLQF